MPFNRVTDMKSMVMWILILKEEEAQSLEALKRDPNTKVKVRKVPMYIPGLMLIPIPEAGFCLGHVDMAFWAVFLYLLGSIFYVIDTYYLWPATNPNYTDDAANPGVYLNTVAAVTFVVNALICFVDWWLQFRQLSSLNLLYDESLTGGVHISDVPQKISVYYFYNNFFFLGAAVIYLIQAIWWENPTTDLENCFDAFCGTFWIEFWGSMLYLLSSVFAVLECHAAAVLRESQGLPPLKFFTTDFAMVDWFGWGDVLLLLTSVVALLQAFLASFTDVADDDFLTPMYLVENWLFLLDSGAYFIGYMLFIYELRQTMKTGLVEAKQTGAINTLIGDNYEDNEMRSTAASNNLGLGEGDDDPDYFRESQFGGVHPRSSIMAHAETTADGRITMAEVRAKLNDARNIRMRKTQERLSAMGGHGLGLGHGHGHGRGTHTVRSTMAVMEMTDRGGGGGGGGGDHRMKPITRSGAVVTGAAGGGGGAAGDGNRQRSASFTGGGGAVTKSPFFS